ncbi:MAG: GTPase domain-containing protein [Actinomycetota bacterium]
MADSIVEFKEALARVPVVLLDGDDARVLRDANTSIGVLENLVMVPRSVVLVGSTGVGKSHLINTLVGSDVSVVGLLRPTTRSIVAAGSAGPVPIHHEMEYVLAPDAPEGVVFVDTPPWEADAEAIRSALKTADLAVLVVSPNRYGDASTDQLWKAMASGIDRLLVMNRIGGTDRDRAALIAAAMERFDVPEVMTVDEGGSSAAFVERVLGAVASADPRDERAYIALSTVTNAGRHLAAAITSSAAAIGGLADAVSQTIARGPKDEGLSVFDSWLATQQELLDEARRSVDLLDRSIVEVAGGDLAQRVMRSLGRWDQSTMDTELVVWRDSASDRFRSDARIRWRRSQTEHLLDNVAWKIGVNPTVEVPKRVRRIMGSRLDAAVEDLNSELARIMHRPASLRRIEWQTVVEELGAYAPGELFSATEGLVAT